MAVLSRPSLRSSAPRSVAPRSPATEDIHQPPRHEKRSRDASQDIESNGSKKKLKLNHPPQTRNPSKGPKRQALKSLPIRDRQQQFPPKSETRVVRVRKLDPVLVQPSTNGLRHSSTDSSESLHTGVNQNLPLRKVKREEKRSLRSHDGGSRSKSELEPYFSNYEELISIEPKEPDLLTPRTILHIYDEPAKPASATQTFLSPEQKIKGKIRPRSQTTGTAAMSNTIEWPDETFIALNNATRLDFSGFDQPSWKSTEDPLDDSVYLKVHAREERKEKQLRNIEKERAMHEKFQLERLLDGLRGHDWLRVMGISGITDGEKKAYEPKRDHLISEVRTLLEKFRLWKEEEKRRKLEREETMDEDEEGESEEDEDMDRDEASDIQDQEGDSSDGDPPDYSDVDASAARQLHMEATMATKARAGPRNSKHASKYPPPKPPAMQKPFTSFFEKPYMRAAAMGKHRRSGRSAMAFGQPIPELEERPFQLPPDVMTAEALQESGRRMRRSKRDSKES